MLPLDPPLTAGARPTWMNPDRPFDDEAHAAFALDPEDPARQSEFARHLLERDPENVWAMTVLATNAESLTERLAMLREALRVGVRLWRPELSGRAPAPDWGADPDSRTFLAAIVAYAVSLADAGHRTEAMDTLILVLELDPLDRIGAAETMRRRGGIDDGDCHDEQGAVPRF